MKDNIRNKTIENISDMLTTFVSSYRHEHKLKFYVGRVEDNNDPDKLGRCKIRVYGVFGNEIQSADLPWANPDFNFIGSSLGSFVVPPINAIVKVYFEQDDIYRPMYTTKVVDRNNLSSEKDENYPDTMVIFESDNGDFLKIDRSTGQTTYRHASGLTLSIDVDGNVTIDNNTPSTEVGNYSVSVKGNVELTSDGDVSIEAAKGSIKLGGSTATQPCNNLPACLFTGAPHSIGKQLPGTPGAANVQS